MAGQDDTKNASARLREGFEPVRKETHPDFEAPVISEGKYEGVFGVGGLVLMEIPEEIVAARKDYFQKQTAGQMQSVKENLMRENAHDTMRIRMERSSQVSKFGGDR